MFCFVCSAPLLLLALYSISIFGRAEFPRADCDCASVNTPPKEIDGARLICFAEISNEVAPTGEAMHAKDGEVLGPATALAICRYQDDDQFYLFYCDEVW